MSKFLIAHSDDEDYEELNLKCIQNNKKYQEKPIYNISEFLKGYNSRFNRIKVSGEGLSGIIIQKQVFSSVPVESENVDLIISNAKVHYDSMKRIGEEADAIICQFYNMGSSEEQVNRRGNYYRGYLEHIIEYEKHLSKRIEGVITYRGMAMSEENIKNEYRVGETYYWTSFHSVTLARSSAEIFLMMNPTQGNLNVVFQIELTNEVKQSKYYLKGYAQTSHLEEVILLPFFSFNVAEKRIFLDPHTDTRKAVIILKECRSELYGRGIHIEFTSAHDIYFVWNDVNINAATNFKYFQLLFELDKLKRVLFFHSMVETRTYINSRFRETFFIMSDGLPGCSSLPQIGGGKGKIALVLMFKGMEYEHWVKNNLQSQCLELIINYISHWVDITKTSKTGDIHGILLKDVIGIEENSINRKESPRKVGKKDTKCCHII